MTVEERAELDVRLRGIEARVEWLRREVAGGGHGPDTQQRIVRQLREHLTALRAACGLPPADDPAQFDPSILRD